MNELTTIWPTFGLALATPHLVLRPIRDADFPAAVRAALSEFIGYQDMEAKNFASLKTVSTGSWLKKSAQGQGLGKEMWAAALSYAFDYLNAVVAVSEAAAWNRQSLGVSSSLGYEPNGVYRHTWGTDVVDVQRVRLTPESFIRPDWKLKVEGHEGTARFLGL
ncbi:GNAT family N-acetyltransferase [Arthrobacter sp. MMS24-S77]